MQLVVEISEDTFFDLKKKQNRTEVDNAILNGTPLPKGHGRLIDVDAIKYWRNDRPNEIGYHYAPKYIIDDAPIIIEADKED